MAQCDANVVVKLAQLGGLLVHSTGTPNPARCSARRRPVSWLLDDERVRVGCGNVTQVEHPYSRPFTNTSVVYRRFDAFSKASATPRSLRLQPRGHTTAARALLGSWSFVHDTYAHFELCRAIATVRPTGPAPITRTSVLSLGMCFPPLRFARQLLFNV
jgi:hypothetical protein